MMIRPHTQTPIDIYTASFGIPMRASKVTIVRVTYVMILCGARLLNGGESGNQVLNATKTARST